MQVRGRWAQLMVLLRAPMVLGPEAGQACLPCARGCAVPAQAVLLSSLCKPRQCLPAAGASSELPAHAARPRLCKRAQVLHGAVPLTPASGARADACCVGRSADHVAGERHVQRPRRADQRHAAQPASGARPANNAPSCVPYGLRAQPVHLSEACAVAWLCAPVPCAVPRPPSHQASTTGCCALGAQCCSDPAAA